MSIYDLTLAKICDVIARFGAVAHLFHLIPHLAAGWLARGPLSDPGTTQLRAQPGVNPLDAALTLSLPGVRDAFV